MASLSVCREVTMPDSRHTWRIKNDDVIHVDDSVFVKLNASNSSLSGIIGNHGGYLCLSRSHGYKELFQLRAKASEHMQKDDEEEDGPTLFDDVKQPKPKRLSLTDMKKARENHETVLTVMLDEKPVVMLAAIHPTDSIYVLFEDATITIVLSYLTSKPFDDEKRPKNPLQLPKGIKRHKLGFAVTYNTEGVTRTKIRRSLDDAIAFQANPAGDVIGGVDQADAL